MKTERKMTSWCGDDGRRVAFPEAWRQRGVPHKGWQCEEVVDLDDAIGRCDFCGTELRYEHRLTHPEWPDEMTAGCICAGALTGDYKQAKQMDAAARRASRLAASKRWKRWGWQRDHGLELIQNGRRAVLRDRPQGYQLWLGPARGYWPQRDWPAYWRYLGAFPNRAAACKRLINLF
jgi:hypothetical protein